MKAIRTLCVFVPLLLAVTVAEAAEIVPANFYPPAKMWGVMDKSLNRIMHDAGSDSVFVEWSEDYQWFFLLEEGMRPEGMCYLVVSSRGVLDVREYQNGEPTVLAQKQSKRSARYRPDMRFYYDLNVMPPMGMNDIVAIKSYEANFRQQVRRLAPQIFQRGELYGRMSGYELSLIDSSDAHARPDDGFVDFYKIGYRRPPRVNHLYAALWTFGLPVVIWRLDGASWYMRGTASGVFAAVSAVNWHKEWRQSQSDGIIYTEHHRDWPGPQGFGEKIMVFGAMPLGVLLALLLF